MNGCRFLAITRRLDNKTLVRGDHNEPEYYLQRLDHILWYSCWDAMTMLTLRSSPRLEIVLMSLGAATKAGEAPSPPNFTFTLDLGMKRDWPKRRAGCRGAALSDVCLEGIPW